jgi:uncharacterized membrane protein
LTPYAYQPRSDTAVTESPRRWLQKRNCAMSPLQLAFWFVSVSLISLSIATVFALLGAWMVLPFSVIEILGLLLAFVFYGRHAGDFEKIEAHAGCLVVERRVGNHLSREEHPCPWVRIEYEGRLRSPVLLVIAGKKIAVGRFVPDHEKAQFVSELRRALVTI